MTRFVRVPATAISLAVLFSAICTAADWPMYRADAARTGYATESLPEKLSLSWVYRACAPRPAWLLGMGRIGDKPSRLQFDWVYQPIAAGGLVLFGSSADGKVYALDAATGSERWVYYTGGPIRFAPAAWRDRVFAGSDDGWLYCLELKTGRLLWKKRGGPSDEKVLGNGYIVSRWPVRGGVVVRNDTVYFSEVNVDQLLLFMRRLDYPAGLVGFVEENRAKLDHLLFDVGFDYRVENGDLRIIKSGYYGVF